MPLKDVKYKRDQTILKVYGYGDNKKIKVIRMNWLRTAGMSVVRFATTLLVYLALIRYLVNTYHRIFGEGD